MTHKEQLKNLLDGYVSAGLFGIGNTGYYYPLEVLKRRSHDLVRAVYQVTILTSLVEKEESVHVLDRFSVPMWNLD